MKVVAIPAPTYDSFEDWANNLSNSFSTYDVPVAVDVNSWREWATSFILINPSLNTVPIPNEFTYPNLEDWKKWAEFFCNSLYTQ